MKYLFVLASDFNSLPGKEVLSVFKNLMFAMIMCEALRT
jgi:hypothetical protein